MIKHIKRRVRRVKEKLEHLAGGRQPITPGVQAPGDSDPGPTHANVSAHTQPTFVSIQSEPHSDPQSLDHLAPDVSQTMDQGRSTAGLDSAPINEADHPNLEQPTATFMPDLGNSIVPAPEVERSRPSQSNRYAKHTTQSGLKALIGVLSESTKEFGPLKSAIDGLRRCIGIYEDQFAAHEEYRRLRIDLENVCREIAGYMRGFLPPSMEPSVTKLADGIEEEINLIDLKTRRNALERYAEAADDADEILMRYRRIQRHLDAFALSAGMKIWQIVDDEATRRRLKELPNSPAAKYCSTQSGSLGRNPCTPNTRVDVIKQLQGWARDSDSRKIYWLNGMAGTGKTTIAYSLCSQLEQVGQLGASFFCSRQLPACRQVGLILPSIAYQFSLSSRPFRYEISAALERDPDVYNQPVDRQFLSLIATPLRKVRSQLREDIVVVVDALDECEDADSVGQILSALIAEASDLPVKVLLTSRPEPAILSRMEKERGEQVRCELHLHELERSIVQSDIMTYLAAELSALNLESSMLAKLAQQSGVLFVYASTVVRYVMHDDLAKSMQRLNTITSTSDSSSHGYWRIDELYATILDGALNDRDLEPSEREEMTKVIRTVVCAQEPLTARAIASLLGLARVESVWTALRPLLSVLQASRATGLVTTLHESFPDYLLDSKRSGDFHCNPKKQHTWFSQTCFETIERLVPFNICNLESSYIPDSEVSGLDVRVNSAISEDVSYACRYWEAHLERTNSSTELMDKLFRFLSARLFLWMEIMNLKHSIDACVIMLSKLDVWLARVQTSAEASELAHDAWRFVNAFASGPIRHMTPHIYISVLALWPRHRPLSQYQSNRIMSLAGAAGTALDRRDANPLATLNASSIVLCAACSPDGARIVSGCRESTICIWNAHTGQQIGEPLVGHTYDVRCVAFSPDSRRVVSGSSDQTIRIWDIYTGQMLGAPLEGHTGEVSSVTYSPDGAHIASGSDDTTVRIWDVQTGQMLGQPLEGHTGAVYSVAYSPDGASIVSGSRDKTIRVWDAQTGRLRGLPLEGHTDEINSVAYSPNGSYIVSGSDDMTVRIWNAETGQMSTKPLEGHTASVWSVACSPDGARIVSGSVDRTVCIWDAGTGQMLGQPLRGHTYWVRSVSFSPDGLRIISGSRDKTIRIWDAHIGQASGQPPAGHTGDVYLVAYSPDGARIASGSRDNTVCIWDAYTGQMVGQPLKGHASYVLSVAYSLDGTRVASGSDDRIICIWDTSSGQMVGQPLEGHTGAVWSVAFSPDGSRIASGSADDTVRIWNAHTGQMVGQPLKGHTNTVYSVAFSPDGARIVSGSRDETIRIWDANTGQMVGQPLEGHTDRVRSVAYSPSGTHIVSGSGDRIIRIWDARTREMVGQPLKGHTGPVTSVAYSPDGARIVSGSDDMTICSWDACTGQMLGQPLEGHTSWVLSVAYSPDGKHIVSGSDDESIRIWNVCALSNSGKKSPDDPNLLRQPSLSSDTPQPISGDFDTSSHIFEPQTKWGLPIRPNPSDPNAWTLSEDGWVVGYDLKPLLWVPPELRDTLLRYENTCMISRKGSWALDLSKAKFGTEWQQCCRP